MKEFWHVCGICYPQIKDSVILTDMKNLDCIHHRTKCDMCGKLAYCTLYSAEFKRKKKPTKKLK